jgi:hypothetical protein
MAVEALSTPFAVLRGDFPFPWAGRKILGAIVVKVVTPLAQGFKVFRFVVRVVVVSVVDQKQAVATAPITFIGQKRSISLEIVGS